MLNSLTVLRGPHGGGFRADVNFRIIAIALIVLGMIAPGQRRLACAVRSWKWLSPMPPPPAEGVRAMRHADTPGDRAEPQAWYVA
jgi:hypothetical protein